jgi:hypothetical protein
MPLSPKLRYALLAAGLASTSGAVYWASTLSQDNADQPAAVAEAVRPRARPLTAAAGSNAQTAPAGDLDLSKLKRDPGKGADADVFGTRSFVPAPPKPKPGAQPPAQVVAAAPPPPPPPPPPVPFAYIGRLAEGGQTTVFLAQGERNLVVRAGDVIDNTYKIEEIGQSALVLTYLPQNVKQTMPIGAPQ